MALEIDREVENTGLILNYHKVEFVLFEKAQDFVEIKIGMYPNKEASQSGKSPVSEYYAQVPYAQFNGSGTLLDIAYNVLKTHESFEGAIDV